MKRALISYITGPLKLPVNYHEKFSNPGIAINMVRVVRELGFEVDVVEWSDTSFKSDKKYDLFIGHGGVNWEYLRKNVVIDVPVKIYFSTGTYWKKQLEAKEERFRRLERRRGVRLSYARSLVSEEAALTDADGLIVLGSKYIAESYAKFPVVHNLNNGVYSDGHFNSTKKNYDFGRRNFLYFGSAGCVHKGLDLLIEVFSKLDAHLWCGGPKEPELTSVYGSELARGNIHMFGWIPLKSPQFYELVDKCNCTILASSSEGSPGGVIECMNQGLIPIVTKEAGIDIKDFGVFFEDDSVETIDRVVREIMVRPVGWHRSHSVATRNEIQNCYSEEVFCHNLKCAIQKIIGERLR